MTDPFKHQFKMRRHFVSIYHEATAEHAFMLRCEGLTYKAIGRRIGVSQTMVKLKIGKLVRLNNLNYPSKRIRFIYVRGE